MVCQHSSRAFWELWSWWLHVDTSRPAAPVVSVHWPHGPKYDDYIEFDPYRVLAILTRLSCVSPVVAEPPQRPARARSVAPHRPGGLLPPAAVLQGLGRAEELDQREDEDGHGRSLQGPQSRALNTFQVEGFSWRRPTGLVLDDLQGPRTGPAGLLQLNPSTLRCAE